MPKFLLQLILALSLVLNAIIAPWAMAGMLGGHHGMAHSSSKADEHAHHGHHAHVTDAQTTVDLEHDQADRCCDGAICQCGCVLPPALSLALIELAPPPLLALRVQRMRSPIATHHQTPLLRPPAHRS